jgi:hypothetical protein
MPAPLMVQHVALVKRAARPLDETSTKDALEQLIGAPVESCSDYTGKVVGRPASAPHPRDDSRRQFSRGVVHPLVGAIHQAYEDHRPLVLSPDMFWLLVAQGLALHINNHADEFRNRFRVGPLKQDIDVRRDDLFKGSPENPWEEVFADFCKEINARIGEDNYSQVVTPFSTTGRVERAATAIALMDCVKSYFRHPLRSRTLSRVPEGSAAGGA